MAENNPKLDLYDIGELHFGWNHMPSIILIAGAMAATWSNKFPSSLLTDATGATGAVLCRTFNNDKQYIKLDKAFREKIKAHPLVEKQNEYQLVEKMKISADALLQMQPDRISLEVTPDDSIFYTIIKGDITIFFEHFLDALIDEDDETMVSVFKGDQKLFNCNGTMESTLDALSRNLSGYNIKVATMV